MLCWSIKGFGFVPLVHFNLFFGSFRTFSCSPNFYNDFILLFHGNIFHLLRGNIWCLYCCKLHKCKLSIILIQNFKELFAFSIQITWFIFYQVDIQALRKKNCFVLFSCSIAKQDTIFEIFSLLFFSNFSNIVYGILIVYFFTELMSAGSMGYK